MLKIASPVPGACKYLMTYSNDQLEQRQTFFSLCDKSHAAPSQSNERYLEISATAEMQMITGTFLAGI